MLGYLLDNNVASELSRPRPDVNVLAWFSAIPDEELFLDAMTVGEIAKGVALVRRRNVARARQLQGWLSAITFVFADRILKIDVATARIWGELSSRTPTPPPADAWIAASALRHGLVVSTRNTRHFEGFGVGLVNPFMPRVPNLLRPATEPDDVLAVQCQNGLHR